MNAEQVIWLPEQLRWSDEMDRSEDDDWEDEGDRAWNAIQDAESKR